ncbi:zinc finger CCHC domain-containing protein 7 [Phyllobates terribilis]|uniref:zinc finger CCHC domain-containing protein 7 n=1 Tax=Phyllobates terribilis TaxID=111132 RepID=UPI003CCAA629
MFNDEDDLAAFEDELYREESSSDESIDSEVEAYLYSQVHYSQNLNEDNIDELDDERKEDDVPEKVTSFKINSNEKKAVIIISDSDDVRASDSSAVLILSESLEEDSIYSSKTKSKLLSAAQHPKNESTPKAPLREKKLSKIPGAKSPSSGKSYKGGIVQEVFVIRGSSEEEDKEVIEEVVLSSDSDLSDVENWMLLGRAREEGDASIQLNVEGQRYAPSEGDTGVGWSIIEKDSESQITNFTPLRRSKLRYYLEDKNVTCRNCNHRGHLSKSCPEPKKLPACCLCGRRGHLQYDCPDPYCSYCFMPGHTHQDCSERPHWQKKCFRCAMIGHYADACPEIWRQYHLTVAPGPMKKCHSASNPKVIVYCCNCGRKGHCGYECNQRRMYSTMYPSCELVFTYDEKQDICRRNWRAKQKLKELQEAGLVTMEAEESHIQDTEENTPLPKKRRKERKKHNKKLKKFKDCFADNSFKGVKKRKKEKFLQHDEAEDYFPRGKPDKPKKNRRAHGRKKPEHLLFKDFTKNEGLDGKLKKCKKKHRKQKSSAVDQSLLIIKQRSKKSKKVK